MSIFQLYQGKDPNYSDDFFYRMHEDFRIIKIRSIKKNIAICYSSDNPDLETEVPLQEIRRLSKSTKYFELDSDPVELVAKFVRLMNDKNLLRELEFKSKNAIHLNWIKNIEEINYSDILNKIKEHLFFSDNKEAFISHEAYKILNWERPNIILNFYLTFSIDLWVFAIKEWVYYVRNDHSSVLYFMKNQPLATINNFNVSELNKYFNI